MLVIAHNAMAANSSSGNIVVHQIGNPTCPDDLHATSCLTPMSALTTTTLQPQDESSLLLLVPGKALAIYAFVSFRR